uniref:Uncharacterized protein n=1 Tax=Anguilla anguilla TaxID=7936 RepID=A0A0E9TZS4_ANGAN
MRVAVFIYTFWVRTVASEGDSRL